MAEPLSPERLAEIRARHAAQVKRYAPDEPLPAAEQVRTLAEDRDRLIGQDVPALLAEVERLNKAVELLGALLQVDNGEIVEALGELARVRAEFDELRAQNAKTEDNFESYAETVAMELARLRGMNARLHTALEQIRLLAVQPDLLRLVERALGEGTAGPAAYVNGDNGTTLCCLACDGHIAHIDPGDDFDRLDAERRAHVCESGGKS